MKVVILILLITVLFSGCTGHKEQKLGNLSVLEQIASDLVQEENTEPVDGVVGLAINDLRSRLKSQNTSIQVTGIIPVEWTDTSLGYPEPGKEYSQETVPGFLIFLFAGGMDYEYHSDYTRIAAPPGIPDVPVEISAVNLTEREEKVVGLAVEHLAERLQVPVTSVQVTQVISTEWSDASLGYPEEGMDYAQVLTPGFVILLVAENTIYEYHSDYYRIVPPPDIEKSY